MAYTPTLPPLRESLKPTGGSPLCGIPVPAVPVAPQDLAMATAEGLEQCLDRAALTAQQPQPPGSAYLTAKPDKVGPEEQRAEVVAGLNVRSAAPPMPKGVRLIRWEPKAAPVAIDVCSVVVDIPKFIESELRAINSRLNNPWSIQGGFTVPQMLDRLAQVGLEVELDPKGGHPHEPR